MSDGSKMDWKTLIFGLLAMVFSAQLMYSMVIGLENIYTNSITVLLLLFSSYIVIFKGNKTVYIVVGFVSFGILYFFYAEDYITLSQTDTQLTTFNQTLQKIYLFLSVLSIHICFAKIFTKEK